MKSRIFSLLLLMLLAFSTTCFAHALPNSEFSLGGIGVANGTTIDYVRSIYGEPRLVSTSKYSRTYMYGDSVTIKTDHYGNSPERVFCVTVTANNGFGTPAGLTVGMKTSTMFRLYGYEKPDYNSRTGTYEYMYPHQGSGAGAGMQISVKHDTIQKIMVIN
ncbi:MAG: hypothetical protein SOV43_09125 [Selenomonadaceae bacterium]|nr:hypothetical protein [Selenomonadaceae bacterium]MDY2686316.1 hypothetical protein [Selenomonadaceae bacterium]